MIRVGEDESKEWLEQSLLRGFEISSAVLSARIFHGGDFWVFGPTGFARRPLDLGVGGVTETSLAQKAFGRFLDDAVGENAQCVVVEDDLRRATDPCIRQAAGPSAFIGNRMIHWCDLKNGGQVCAENLGRAAFGYPLNAFVVREDPSRLGLKNRQQAPDEIAELIVENLTAVIVAAFDNESFLIWTVQP